MKRSAFLWMVMLLCGVMILSAGADSNFAPWQSYVYNADGDPVNVPNAYLPVESYNGNDLGVGNLNAPEDLFVAPDGRLYLLDTGNNRLVIAEKDLSSARTIETFHRGEEEHFLNAPTGLFVDESGNIYLCDGGNRRILICDEEGKISRIIEKPTDPEYPEESEFEPEKITVDNKGSMYVICKHIYQGAVVFNHKGEFEGYFGATQVQSSLQLLWQRALRRLMTAEQRQKLAQYVPTEFENLTIRDGFIYTVSFENSAGGTDMQNAIRCLNPSGSNIAKNDQPFGDLDTYYSKEAGGMVTSTFRDLCVSEDEYLYALDDTSGKIFIYDSTYTLLFVFGGSGDQKGTFRNPAAIDLMGNQIVVLDRGKNSITTFEPTDFFQTVHSANQLFHAGMYQEALEPWNQVLRECADYPAACRGIGRALFNSGDYAEAMNYFEKANDKASYSDAFKYYRLELLGDQFILWLCLIAGGVILLVVAVKWLFPLVKPKLAGAVGKLPSQARRKLQAPFNCLFHPFTGFEEMREQDLASWPVSLGILAVYILVSLIQMEGTGFIFREGQGDVTDLGQTVMMICGIYALWAVSSMALRTFLGGRARLRDVCGATSAMLIPLCLTTLANTLISQFIIADEGSLLSGISIVGLIWAAGMLIGGIRGINEYELGRTVGAILLTALFCCLILFLLILFLSSFQQVYSLFGTIFSEFKYRFL